MSFLHIANTHFEAELACDRSPLHPIFLQLQFLPLLYAEPRDGILATHFPYPSYPQIHLMDEHDLHYDKIEDWGASLKIAAWAKQHHIRYDMPEWDVVKKVNSKEFSFTQSPKLPQAELLYSFEDLHKWEQKVEGPKVLKTCFGVSGKGHLRLPADPKKFAQKEFAAGRPLIGEPWVERKLDFSTQWKISPEKTIEYLGATVLLSDRRGSYKGNLVGDLSRLFGKYLPLLEQHQEIARPLLEKIATLGFFGNVGIDAMIWGNDKLHPVVEINARKTMGWIALEILKHRFRKQTIALSYSSESTSHNLLPEAIVEKNGSLIHFSKKLTVDVLA